MIGSVRTRTALTSALGLLSLLVSSGASFAEQSVWQPLGPRAATTFALKRDPTNPSVVYAGMYFGGLYRSGDGGITWSPVRSIFSESSVFAIAVAPATPPALLVATFDHGLQRSTDGGTTWVRLPVPGSLAVHDVAVDPTNPQIVLAATYDTLWRSSDGGATWTPASGAAPGAATILFDPNTAGLAYLGTNADGVFLSRNSGQTWEAQRGGLSATVVIKLELDAAAAGAVLASTTAGVFRLASSEDEWEDLTFDLAAASVAQVVRHPSNGALLAATDTGVFRLDTASPTQWVPWTTVGARLLLLSANGGLVHVAETTGSLTITGDGGQTFYPADYGIQNRFIESLTTLGVGGQTIIYAGTDQDVLFTTEAYRTPRELPWAGANDLRGGAFTVAAHPTTIGTLFSGTEGAGVWKTTDFGISWTSSSNGIVPAGVFALDQSPVGDRILYAGTSYGIFASTDGGLSWSPNIDTTPRPVSVVLADPVRHLVGFYGTSDGEIFRTFDGGRSFNRAWEGVGKGIQSLAAAPWGDIYAVNAAGELYSSDDLGTNFYRRASTIEHRILTIVSDPIRPWVSYLGTVFGGVYKSESNAIEWTASNTGIDVPIVFALAIDPSRPATIYAGSLDAVYKSIDGAASWQKLTQGLATGSITAIEVDPTDANRIYASVTGRGVYRSTDGGAHWALVQQSAPFLGGVPIAVSPLGTVLIGSQGAGVQRSANQGLTWTPSNDGLTVFIKDIVIDPVNPQIMYAASLVDGVFRTIDGGATWTHRGLAGRLLYSLTIDAQAPQTLYGSTPTGPVRSIDGGLTWIDLGQRMAYAFALASDPSNRATVYAGGGGGALYRSHDSARTWTLSAVGLPSLNVTALVVDAAAQRVYAGVNQDGIYVSTNGGDTWQRTSGSETIGVTVSSFAVGCAPGHIYASTVGEGLFKTVDGGDSWTQVGQTLPSPYVSRVQVDRQSCAIVFASLLSESGTGTSLYRSENAGLTWQSSSAGINSATIFDVAIDPANSNILAVATAAGVYTSQNGGASWQPANNGLAGVAVRRILIHAAELYVGTEGQGIYRSTGPGASWTAVPAPFNALHASGLDAAAAPGQFYVASAGNGVLYTSASGTLQGGTEADYALAVFHKIVIDPQQPSTLYAATGGQGVLKSLDAGITWRSASTGLDFPFLISLVIDPIQPATLYAGTTGSGVMVTDNAGASWQPLNAGLFHRRVVSMTIDVNDHRTIYAGTEGGGVFRLRR